MKGSLVKDLVRVCVAAAIGMSATFCTAMLLSARPQGVRQAAAEIPGNIESTSNVYVF